MFLSLKSSLNGSISTSVAPDDPVTALIFHGATSASGGSEYQMGTLRHTITMSNGVATVSVEKGNPNTDVDISNFQTTGTVATNASATFKIKAIGRRNNANSTIQGGSTEDSVGINGGRPGKIDIVGTNRSEKVVFEINDLDPSFTFRIKGISVTRVSSSSEPTQPTAVILNGFDGNEANYYPPSGSAPTDITSFNSFGSQSVTVVGTGSGNTAGSFAVGIDGADASSYGLYSIDFDIE